MFGLPASILSARSECTGGVAAGQGSRLLTPAEVMERLRCSRKTLAGHVASGALRYVVIGLGKTRPRRMFTDDDVHAFIERQTRRDVPIPPLATGRVRRSIALSPDDEVIGFTARRAALEAERLKKAKKVPGGSR